MEETYESVLLVKNEVYTFKIPPQTTNRAQRAADWNLNDPQWTGRMRLVAKGKHCILKLEDKISGELFAKCPIEQYPGVALESVSDSSRYFVLRLMDDNGRTAYIGLGFTDRSDSFDLNVALQDHFNWLKKNEEIEKEKEAPKPGLDLRFKEGETIKINMKITKKDGSETSSKSKGVRTGGGGGLGLLPPPPASGSRVAPHTGPPAAPSAGSSPSHHHPPIKPGPGPATASDSSSWSDFASAPSPLSTQQHQPSNTATTPSNANWVQF